MAKKRGVFDSIFKRIGLKIYDFNDPDECLLALEDKDPELRIRAIEGLISKRDLEDITPIIRIMEKDTNFQVQEAAMNALGELKNNAAVVPLISMLRASDQWLRVKAAMILAQIGDPRALKPIIDASQDMKGEYRATIDRLISKLEAITSQRAEPFLNGAVEEITTESEVERESSVFAFEIEDKKLVGKLRAYDEGREDIFQLKHKEFAPPEVLKHTEDKLEEKLRFQLSRASSSRADEKIVEYYLKALKYNDRNAEENLISCLRGPSESIRLQALQALTEINRKPHIVDALLDIINECSSQMCWRVIVALSGVEDVKVAEKILPFIEDVDNKIRKFAQNYFLIYPSEEMIEVLMRDYKTIDENSQVERASLIARMDSDAAKPVIRKLLQDLEQRDKVILSILDKLPPRQEDVISSSLPVILRRKDESLIDAVMRRLKDKNNLLLLEFLRMNLESFNEIVRGRSALLLGQLKDLTSASSIARLLDDPSGYVRLKAAKALFALNSKDHFSAICAALKRDPYLKNKLEYIQIIEQSYKAKSLDLFLELMQEDSSEIRYLLLESLSKKVWNAQDKEKIIESVQQFLEDKDIRVIFYTVVLLVKLGSRKFAIEKQKLLSVLWTIIKDDRNPTKIRREALFSMLYLSKEDAKEVLKSLVKKDADDEIRIQSAYYLANFEGEDVLDALQHACRSPKKNVASAARETIKKIQSKMNK